MHYLHKILVYIPDAVAERDLFERCELADAIRAHAESVTENYYQTVFDWRETDSAGRWSHRYPENVILAEDDVEHFVKELMDAKENQSDEVQLCFSQLENTVGTDLKHIVDVLLHRNSFAENENGVNCMTAYYLHCIAAYLYGEYQSDSFFYHTHDYTAFLYAEDLETIRKSPSDWALVMFDYHN